MASQNMIELIKVLRERTGAGMMDCKKALEETNMDVEKACDWLREKGIAKAVKKASRIAAEGLTTVLNVKEKREAIILEVNCETDFVARGDAFKDLIISVSSLLLEEKPADLEAAKELTKDLFIDASVKIGEKLDLRRFQIVTYNEGEGVGTYIHMGGKISTLVVLDKEDAELEKGLAMHIAANSPIYIAESDVPASVIEHEKTIQLEASKKDEKLQGKPLPVLEKIVEGKVRKALSEQTLFDQTYLLDGETKVETLLKNKGVKIKSFIRYQVGEGLEKRADNFAEEVMKEMK